MSRPDTEDIVQNAIAQAHQAWANDLNDEDLGHEVVLAAEALTNPLPGDHPSRLHVYVLLEAAFRLSRGVWPKPPPVGSSLVEDPADILGS